jgi:hypothetical protein
VIARVPLDEGGLTGTLKPDSKFAEGDHRSCYFRGDRAREAHERVARIASDLGITEAEVPDTALRYVLSEPTVSTVISGHALEAKRRAQHRGVRRPGPRRAAAGEAPWPPLGAQLLPLTRLKFGPRGPNGGLSDRRRKPWGFWAR